MSEPSERQDGPVSDAALDPRHVGPVQLGAVSERLLGPAALVTQAADRCADRLEEGVERLAHAAMLGSCGLLVHGRSSTPLGVHQVKLRTRCVDERQPLVFKLHARDVLDRERCSYMRVTPLYSAFLSLQLEVQSVRSPGSQRGGSVSKDLVPELQGPLGAPVLRRQPRRYEGRYDGGEETGDHRTEERNPKRYTHFASRSCVRRRSSGQVPEISSHQSLSMAAA